MGSTYKDQPLQHNNYTLTTNSARVGSLSAKLNNSNMSHTIIDTAYFIFVNAYFIFICS